jgi:hypothetical protein
MRIGHLRVILLFLPANDIGFAGYPPVDGSLGATSKTPNERPDANADLMQCRVQRQAAFAARLGLILLSRDVVASFCPASTAALRP